MSFLGRAKRFLQDLGTDGSSRTQTFNLACASGHRVRGERTEGYQALRCPSCGEGVFVLPRSPLPEPVAPAGAVESRGVRTQPRSPWADEGPIELTDPLPPISDRDDDRSDGVVWDEEPAEAAPRRSAPAAPRVAPEDLAAAEIEEARRAPRPEAPSRREPAAARPARSRRPKAAARPVPELLEPRPRSRRGPRVGLIFAMLAVLILGTIGFRMWRNQRAQYPLIAERGRTEGIPALDAGEFDRAHQLLSAARAAVDALGGRVGDADEIRQAADEAAVFVDLCPKTLEELLGQAHRPDWATTFETLYKGRYYLFDSFIAATPGEGGGGAYQIGYVVFPPGEASRFGDGGFARPERFARIDLSGFELFEVPKPPRGTHVTFGARLRSIDYDDERGEWVVRVEPKEGAFITHTRALEVLGWPDTGTFDLPAEDQP